MNKAQLVNAVIKTHGMSRKDAVRAVDAVLDTITRTVTSGESVSVTGFGTFYRSARAARLARNPQNGDRVRVAETAVPRFRAGQGFKDLVSGATALPETGTAVRKAPKGSLTSGKAAAK